MKKITLLLFTIISFYWANAQDTCATALAVTAGTTTVAVVDGTEVPVPECAPNAEDPDMRTAGEWFSFTATEDAAITVTTDLPANLGRDTRVHVYSGTCGALTCVAGADDVSASVFLSTVSFGALSGETYYFAFDDRWENNGFDFELTVAPVTCQDGSLPFTDDFTDPNTLLVCWGTIDSDGDGLGWGVVDYDLDNNMMPDGDPTLVSSSWTAATNALTPDNWVISTALDLTPYSAGDVIELTWDARGIDADFADENYTAYAASGDQTTDFLASGINFNEVVGQNGGAGVFVSRTLDISSLAGQMAYVAFRHHGVTDQFALNIDNIQVNVTLSVDEFESNTLSHYYDKATKMLNIESSNSPMENIEIYNILGQNVNTKTLSKSSETINVSPLRDGVYIAKVSSGINSKTFKFVKN